MSNPFHHNSDTGMIIFDRRGYAEQPVHNFGGYGSENYGYAAHQHGGHRPEHNFFGYDETSW